MKQQIKLISAVWLFFSVLVLIFLIVEEVTSIIRQGLYEFEHLIPHILFWTASLAMSILAMLGRRWAFRMLGVTATCNVAGCILSWVFSCSWSSCDKIQWLALLLFAIYTIIIVIIDIKRSLGLTSKENSK